MSQEESITAATREGAEEISSNLSPATMERLAFLRYLYSIGLEQSRQPEPLAAVSILSFHDSVDLFLQLAAECTRATLTSKKPVFAEYFSPINKAIEPKRLSHERGMMRLNDARNAVKHNSFLLAGRDIEQLRTDVTAFFEDNTPLIFGTEFGAVSLVSLVRSEPARKSLKEAETHLASGEREQAQVAIGIAFAQLIDDYEEAATSRYGRSPFTFGESFAFDSSFYRRRSSPFDKQSQFEDKLMDSVVALQEVVKILGLGIDYRRYTKFRLLTPVVRRIMSSERYVTQIMPKYAGGPNWPPSAEACRFCFDFVIDTAIRLQELDLTLTET